MRNKLMILTSFLVLVVLPWASFASNDRTEEYTPRTKKIFLEPEKSVLEAGKFKFLLAGTAGYDNNANLNSERVGDSFLQTFFKASFTTPLSEETDGKVDYEMMNLLYASESQLSLTRNGVRLGLDHKLSKDLQFLSTYSFDSVQYFNTGSDAYYDNSMEFKLAQQLPFKLFHSVSYDVLFRNYEKRYTRTTDGSSTDKPRDDWRHTIEYSIGKYFKKDMIKLTTSYYNNNSNDPYMNYYDYDSYRLGGSLTHLFNNKLSGLLAYSKQYRDYRSRTLIADALVTEFEKSDLATAALFYSFNSALSVGLNYNYRQNHSNEPIDGYSGSIISLSTYYKF